MNLIAVNLGVNLTPRGSPADPRFTRRPKVHPDHLGDPSRLLRGGARTDSRGRLPASTRTYENADLEPYRRALDSTIPPLASTGSCRDPRRPEATSRLHSG